MLALVQYPHDSRGATGMKVTKTELIRLARLVQKDIASGRVSKNAQQAVEVLADYQNSAIELLELALGEGAKEQSKNSLFDSFAFLLYGTNMKKDHDDIHCGYDTHNESNVQWFCSIDIY